MRKGYTIALLAFLVLGGHGHARADESCVKVPEWLSSIGTAAANMSLTPHVEADKEGDDAKRLIAAMNAAPPPTDFQGDEFLVVSLKDKDGNPVPFDVVGFFANGCMSKQMKATLQDAEALMSGNWPKAPGA